MQASLLSRTNKKVSFVWRTKETFLRDAFLAERDAHCVRDAGFACDARLRRVQERIVSPITAQRHHLSLIFKAEYFTMPKGHYFTFADRQIFHFFFLQNFPFLLFFALIARLLSMITCPQNWPGVPKKNHLNRQCQ